MSAPELKALSHSWPSLTLTPDQLASLELLLSGVLDSPLHPLPDAAPAALRDPEGNLLAVRDEHGALHALRLPIHHDHLDLRLAPSQLDPAFHALPAFFATHPPSLDTLARLSSTPSIVFLFTGPNAAFDPFTLVRCWRAALAHLPANAIRLVALPLDVPPHPAALDEIARSYRCSSASLLAPDPSSDYPPEIAREIERRYPPRPLQGFTVFFTGLSGSGKSTIANIVRLRLLERGRRSVSLLDGDLVRQMLSSELGFSAAHRDLNILRIGFVAAEITRAGGVALCAPIAPYQATREKVREMIEPHGGFFLVHVSTPLEVCESRDTKGLYAKARAGLIAQFTGVSDPYEIPAAPALTLDTAGRAPDESAGEVVTALEQAGYLLPEASTHA